MPTLEIQECMSEACIIQSTKLNTGAGLWGSSRVALGEVAGHARSVRAFLSRLPRRVSQQAVLPQIDFAQFNRMYFLKKLVFNFNF